MPLTVFRFIDIMVWLVGADERGEKVVMTMVIFYVNVGVMYVLEKNAIDSIQYPFSPFSSFCI